MRKQRGITMIGWIFLLVPIGIVLYAAIRVGPEYYEFYKVLSAVKEVAKQLEGEEGLSPARIRSDIQRRFDTGYVDDFKAEELEVTRSETGGWNILLDRDSTVPLFGNLYLTIDFDQTVTISPGNY
jgi:hypothetical protein